MNRALCRDHAPPLVNGVDEQAGAAALDRHVEQRAREIDALALDDMNAGFPVRYPDIGELRPFQVAEDEARRVLPCVSVDFIKRRAPAAAGVRPVFVVDSQVLPRADVRLVDGGRANRQKGALDIVDGHHFMDGVVDTRRDALVAVEHRTVDDALEHKALAAAAGHIEGIRVGFDIVDILPGVIDGQAHDAGAAHDGEQGGQILRRGGNGGVDDSAVAVARVGVLPIAPERHERADGDARGDTILAGRQVHRAAAGVETVVDRGLNRAGAVRRAGRVGEIRGFRRDDVRHDGVSRRVKGFDDTGRLHGGAAFPCQCVRRESLRAGGEGKEESRAEDEAGEAFEGCFRFHTHSPLFSIRESAGYTASAMR